MDVWGNVPIFIRKLFSERMFSLGAILSDKISKQEEDVPHGAILSFTLFNVNINDIMKQADHGVQCSLHVHGFVTLYKSPNFNAFHRKVQHTRNRLGKCTLENGYTFFLFFKLEDDLIQFAIPWFDLGHKTYLWTSYWISENWLSKSLIILKVLSRTEWDNDLSTKFKSYRALVK